MTVQTTATKVTATCNGSATVFSFGPLVIFDATQLEVVLVETATGLETPLSLGTGSAAYAVITPADGYPGTSSIRYPEDEVTPQPSGFKLVMKRVLPLLQQTDLKKQGGYFPDTQERQFDKLLMIDLQQQEEIDRTIKVPISTSGTFGAELPPVVADEFLKYSSDGLRIETSSLTALAAAGNTEPVRIDGAGTGGTAGVSSEFSRKDHVHELPDTISQGLTFTGQNIFDALQQTIRYTDDGAAGAPFLKLDRASSSPATNDVVGLLAFTGRDSAAAEETYARMYGFIIDPTAGSEDGRLHIQTVVGGTLADRLFIGQGLWTQTATGGDPGADKINAQGYYTQGTMADHIEGLTLSNNGTDADHDIDIAVGLAVDGGRTDMMRLTSGLTKQLDAAWAAGTNAGGLDTGTVAASTWYHVWLIRNPATGAIDVLFSTSATSPTMPSGYTQKRRIGAVLTNTSANISPFVQVADHFYKVPYTNDFAQANVGTATLTLAASVPPGLPDQIRAKVVLKLTESDWDGLVETRFSAWPTKLGSTDPTAQSNTNAWIYQHSENTAVGTDKSVMTEIVVDSNAQYHAILNRSAADLFVYASTIGWVDPRGRAW